MMNTNVKETTGNANAMVGSKLISDGFYCVATGIIATGAGIASVGLGIGSIVVGGVTSVGKATVDSFKTLKKSITK